jgi:hypothetical protein
MNTGIQDAYNLGWKVGQVLSGAPDALLDTYEEERLPVAASLLGITMKLHRQVLSGNLGGPQRGPETLQLGIPQRLICHRPRPPSLVWIVGSEELLRSKMRREAGMWTDAMSAHRADLDELSVAVAAVNDVWVSVKYHDDPDVEEIIAAFKAIHPRSESHVP